MTITLVQSKVVGDDTLGAQIRALTLNAAATAGNLLFCVCAPDKNSGAITVPTGFTQIGATVIGSGVSGAICYKIATGGETTISYAIAGTNSRSAIAVLEFSGIATSSPLDQSTVTDSSSTSVSSLAATTGATTQANEFALGVYIDDTVFNIDGPSFAWTNGFTTALRYSSAEDNIGCPGIVVGTKTLSATGAVSTTASYTGTADEAILWLATFKAAAASAVTASPAVGAVIVTGQQPTVTVVAAGATLAAPHTGGLVVTGHPPSVLLTGWLARTPAAATWSPRASSSGVWANDAPPTSNWN